MSSTLANITKGSADVIIDGRNVGTVSREMVQRRSDLREETGASTKTDAALMGSQTVTCVTEVPMWVAHRWSGTVRTEFGAAATRAEAVKILEAL